MILQEKGGLLSRFVSIKESSKEVGIYMHRVVKISVKNRNVGTGLLISLEDNKENDVVLTVCHIFGENKGDIWEMWEIEPDDVQITSDYYLQQFEVTDILYKDSDAEDKDVALIYIKKPNCIIDEPNPNIPYDDKYFFYHDVFIEGYGQEEKNDTSRVINGKIYDYSNDEKKLYRINYIESDRVDGLSTADINKGMSGAPVYLCSNNNLFFLGMQKIVPSKTSTDGILGVFTYKYCLELVKTLYNIELPLKSNTNSLIDNDALFKHIHIIKQKFNIIPADKEHIGASIEYEDISELRDDFLQELIYTIVNWVYSSEKYEKLKQNSIIKGKTEQAASVEIYNKARSKFRRRENENIIAQGQIAELLLFHFIQRYLGAIPLLRKENIQNIKSSDSTSANVIHYKNENDENIIVLGSAKSFTSKYKFKDAFEESLDSILNAYKNHKNEIELYIHEDFLDKGMKLIAESYINRTMEKPKVYLVDFIMYNEIQELSLTDEDDIRNQIDSIIKERYNEFEDKNIDIKKNAILNRIIYILFPVWEIEKLAELFQEFL